MNTDMKKRVEELLKTYRDRKVQIDILIYKMQHGNILSDEMIEAMALGHGDSMGSSGKGYISDKTMYIALNYQEQMDRLNVEAANDIAGTLLKLKTVQNQLEYYVSLLDKRQEEVIRLTFFEGIDQDGIAKSLGVVPRTLRRIKKEAIEKLTKMYTFTEDLT